MDHGQKLITSYWNGMRYIGLYRTSPPVQKSGKFPKSGLSGNRTFSFPDAGILKLLKIEEKIQIFFFNFFLIFFFSNFEKTNFWIFFFYF